MSQDRRPGPAVKDGVPQYTSVSAINRFMDCERSWYFRYVQGLPDPVGKAAQVGIEAHGRIEHYLTTGENVLSPMELAGAEYIPAPELGHLIEHRVDGILTLGKIPLIGGMDLVDLSGPETILTDWKFKGDLERGATKPEWLKSVEHSDGRQMLGYAESFRREFKATGSVTLRHVHFRSRSPFAAEATSVRVGLDEAKEKWDYLSDILEVRIRSAAAAPRPEDVKPTYGHCHKYRKPCVYMRQCQGGAAKLGALFKPKGPAQPTAPAAPQAPKVTEAPRENTMSMLAKMKGLSAGTIKPPPIVVDVQAGETEEQATARAAGAATGAPGESQISGREPNGSIVTDGPGWAMVTCSECGADIEKGPPGHKINPALCPNKAAHGVASATPSVETIAGTAAPTTEEKYDPLPPPRKRGRPRKTEAAPPLAGHVAIMVPQEVIEAAETPAPVATPAADKIRLYFGCAPIGVLTQSLSSFAIATNAEILKELGDDAIDVRLSDHDALKFGRWKAVVSRYVVANPPPPGFYVIGYGDDLVEATAAGLASVAGAGEVVRG